MISAVPDHADIQNILAPEKCLHPGYSNAWERFISRKNQNYLVQNEGLNAASIISALDISELRLQLAEDKRVGFCFGLWHCRS